MRSESNEKDLFGIVMRTHFVFFVVFLAMIRPITVCGNLAQNPSMEGAFITQGSLGDVAEDWIGWADWQHSLEGEFSESGAAHTGSKAQKIAWDEPYNNSPTGGSSFGYEGIYQQIHSLQPGQLYRASAWFKGTMSGSFPVEGLSSFSLFGAIGADPDAGTDPGAVSHWPYIWMTWAYWPFHDIVFPAWTRLGTVFSANGGTASVYVRMSGSGTNYTQFYDPELGYVWQAHPWHVDCYIDDVVVEPTEIGPGSSVQATSPIPANGADRCVVTITVLDGSGLPLQGVPASEIVVGCTGSSNTIDDPKNSTDANGVTAAYITSREAEFKTITVTVFGVPLADTPSVEFYGSFGPIWYVDADATGADNGSSWTNAFTNLQDALAIAQASDEIWVAQGTYAPGSGRTDTFQLKGGVAVQGGYAGFGESDPNARDINAHETILTGDLDGDDGPDFANNTENSYHVATGSGTDATAILDGFTITAGNANGSSSLQNNGGGMLINNGSPTLTHCTFTGNAGDYGAGLGNYNASPAVMHCTFTANHAETGGGGMANDANAAPTVTYCEFAGNSGEFGGAMRSYNGSPTVTNCTFSGNSASYGGAVRNYAGAVELRDCTFTDNSAEATGGGMYNSESNPNVVHCTFVGNSAGEAGGGMFNGDNSPAVTDCTFSGNAANLGGGMLNHNSRATLAGCTFSGNSADSYGGGTFDYGSDPIITNCALIGNSAGLAGGGMAIENSVATLTNCTFSNNVSANGNALVCDSDGLPSDVGLTNCILWDGGSEIENNDGSTIAVSYSDIQGGWPGQGNIDTDPSFVNAGYWDPNGTPLDPNDDFWVDGNYRLMAGSPCIDAGDNSAVPVGITTDLDGKPRFSDDPNTTDTGSGIPPIVDMGAYEFPGINLIIGDFCGPNFGSTDGYVDVWDLMQFADHWHTRTGEGNWDAKFDLAGPTFADTDGYVDVWDLMVFADHWHEGEPP